MSETALTIRTFEYPEDYPTVYALWNAAGPGIHVRRSDDPDQIVSKLERDPDLFLLAELDGQVVGTVLGGFDGRRGMVYHLAVAEALPPTGHWHIPDGRAGGRACAKKAACVITCSSPTTTWMRCASIKHEDGKRWICTSMPRISSSHEIGDIDCLRSLITWRAP